MKKYYLIVAALIVCLSCHKKNSDMAYTFQNIVDSMGVPLSRACWIDSTDSVVFNPDQTISENHNGQILHYGINYNAHVAQGTYRKEIIITLSLNQLLFPADTITKFAFYDCMAGAATFDIENATDTVIPFHSHTTRVNLHLPR